MSVLEEIHRSAQNLISRPWPHRCDHQQANIHVESVLLSETEDTYYNESLKLKKLLDMYRKSQINTQVLVVLLCK